MIRLVPSTEIPDVICLSSLTGYAFSIPAKKINSKIDSRVKLLPEDFIKLQVQPCHMLPARSMQAVAAEREELHHPHLRWGRINHQLWDPLNSYITPLNTTEYVFEIESNKEIELNDSIAWGALLYRFTGEPGHATMSISLTCKQRQADEPDLHADRRLCGADRGMASWVRWTGSGQLLHTGSRCATSVSGMWSTMCWEVLVIDWISFVCMPAAYIYIQSKLLTGERIIIF